MEEVLEGQEQLPKTTDKLSISSKEESLKLRLIPQGAGSRFDSDTVDGIQTSPATNPQANTLVPLDTTGKYPASTIPTSGLSGANMAKAWVRFNGQSTPSITDSFNVSSITDNGTGDWTINFTTALSNSNYCVVGSAGETNATPSDARILSVTSTSTTGARINVRLVDNSLRDADNIFVVVFGN